MAEYRIDDLAREAGTTARNVRAYQERGLLPQPTKRAGRALIYDESHLARLQIIDALLQRGFTTSHIADFITSWETGKDLTEVLGLQQAVTATWGQNEQPLEVPRELVDTVLTQEGPVDDDQLTRLAELGLLRMHEDTVEFTRPELVETFAELHGYGFGLRTLTELYATVLEQVDDVADLMISAGRDRLVDQHGPGWLPDSDAEISETAAMLNQLRDLGVRAVHLGLAQALDRSLAHQLGDYLADAASRHRSEGN